MKNALFLIFLAPILLPSLTPATAEAAEAAGAIFLSEVQRRNLGLQIVEAGIHELARTAEVSAVLVVPPEKHGQVSAPFAGKVTEVLVKLGQSVRAGDPVLKVTPLAVGSPAQTLVSPIAGHVIRQNSMPGRTFTSETSLVEVGDDSELLAQGLFFQSPILNEIKLGARATFLVDVHPGETFPGVLQRIDTGHGPEDPVFHIYAAIPNPRHQLRPNFRGRLLVELEAPQAVVAIPRRAVLGSLGKLFVFVENEDAHFEKREVILGLRSGDLIEIVEGLLPGEKVVTVGNYQLQYVLPEGSEPAAADPHAGHTH